MRAAAGGRFERFGPVLRRVDLVAFAHEVVAHEFEDVDLVIDQQDAVVHGFGSYFPADAGGGLLSCAKIRIFRRKPSADGEK